MTVQILPSTEDCMKCEHCDTTGAAPSEICMKCMSNPANTGTLMQFIMGHDNVVYAIVLVDNEFWLVDIENLKYIESEDEDE